MTDPDSSTDGGNPVGPDEADIPDDVPDLDGIDPFETTPEAGEDLDDFVSREWRESTTARERVRDVLARTVDPVTVAEVAEIAAVSEPTARTTLNRLVDDGVVVADDRPDGTQYRRNPDWYRLQRIQRLAEIPRETVEDVLQRLDGEIRSYRETYGADSPDALVIDGGTLGDEAWRDVSAWRTALLDRHYVKTALQFRRLREAEARMTGEGPGGAGDGDERLPIDQ